jgi:hypothetical protein
MKIREETFVFWGLIAAAVALLVGGTIGNYRAEMDRCAAKGTEVCVATFNP